MRQFDLAGNRTDSAPLSFTLDTQKPGTPSARLSIDSGRSNSDGITNEGTIRIEGLEAGATWEYSLDNGQTWSTQGITSDNTVRFTDNGTQRSLQVRQIDRAGNISDASAKLQFTVDTTAPRAPRIALTSNTSGDDVQRLTKDGRITVSDLDGDTVWQYSTDNGANWTTGSGNSFTVSGDGNKQLLVRKTDAAGNTSTSAVLTMRLDTTAPAKPGLASLVSDTGSSSTDRITSDGRLLAPAPSEADLRFEYSLDNGTSWSDMSQAVRGLRDGGTDGEKTVIVRSRDAAGNVSVASDAFRFTLDTRAPDKPGPAALAVDTGESSNDRITSNGQLLPSSLPEPGTSYEYSVDNGAWTELNVPIKGNKDGGMDGLKNVRLRLKDAAGNISASSEVFSFTLDTIAPSKPTLALAKPQINGSTDDGTVRIGNREADTRWEYSLDRGTSWTVGTGDSLKVKGIVDGAGNNDGSKSVLVRQIDKAGNTTVSDLLEFNLVTRIEAPVVNVVSPLKVLADGTAVVDAASGPGKSMTLEVSGRRGGVAVLAREDGSEIERKSFDNTGKASFNLNRSLTVSGLKTVTGGGSSANAVYTLLSSQDVLALRNSAGAPFSAAYLTGGAVTLDPSKPVYSTGNGAGDWFVWSAIGGGYVISRKNDSSEWFRELPSGQPAQTPEAVTVWQALNRSASVVADDLLRNNGSSSHQNRLDAVSVVNANGARDAAWTYKITQLDAQGHVSDAANLKLQVATSLPPQLDLDGQTDGIQASRSIVVSTAEIAVGNGVALWPELASFKANDIRAIELVSNNNGASISGEMAAPVANDIASVRLTLPGGDNAASDALWLGDSRFSTRNNIDFSGSLGSVANLEVHYVAATRLATITRSGGALLDGLQVKAILESLRYSFAAPAIGRVIGIDLVDRANNVSHGEVVLALDGTAPTSLSTTLVNTPQAAFGMIKLQDVFGTALFAGSNPHNFAKGENVSPALPSPFTNPAAFLAAIRGLSAEWGGTAITGNANSSNANIKSYTLFNQPLASGQEFALMQQGAGNNVLGTWLNFSLVRPAGNATDNLFLNHLGSFSQPGTDLYQVGTNPGKTLTGIDLANIGLLYQFAGGFNKTPTIQVGYDGSRAVVGDVVTLMEGNTILARKVLTSDDVGAGNKVVSLKVAQSLTPGEHDIVARYTDAAGNTVSGPAQHVSVPAGGDVVTLSNLAVRHGEKDLASAQALNTSETGYAMISEVVGSQASGHAASGPVFSGRVGGGRATDRYVVTIEMGGKIVAFDEVAAGDFSISIPSGILPAGMYRDINITASLSTGSSSPGQSTAVQGLKMGWYWAQQSAGDIVGGNGNDDIMLGATRFSAATIIQTGAGDDRIIVGSFGRSENLSATVGDFTLGVDKVRIFNQDLSAANLSRFVTASAGPTANDTRLVIDLDGAGPGTLTYTLHLQNVVYNAANTNTIFGV